MTWAFKANFSNIRPAGGSSRRLTEEGYYKVTIRDTEETTTKAGNARALFRLVVADGDHSGATETFGLNLPQDEDDWVLSYWMVLLLSIGVSEEKLSKGDVKLEANTFKGKTGYLHFTPAPEGGYAAFKWVTKLDYDFYTKQSDSVEEEEEPVEAKPVVAKPKAAAPPETVKTEEESGDPLSFLDI